MNHKNGRLSTCNQLLVYVSAELYNMQPPNPTSTQQARIMHKYPTTLQTWLPYSSVARVYNSITKKKNPKHLQKVHHLT
jgi:hypothetical protein